MNADNYVGMDGYKDISLTANRRSKSEADKQHRQQHRHKAKEHFAR